GRALIDLMASIGNKSTDVLGFHFLDASYGKPDTIIDTAGWAAAAITRDATKLASLKSEAERAQYLRRRGSSLRIVFRSKTGTAKMVPKVDEFLRAQLAAVPDPAIRKLLARQWRVQAADAGVGHMSVPAMAGGRLLVDPGDDLKPGATDFAAAPATPAAPARSKALASALVFGESPRYAPALDVPDSGERAVHMQRLRAHRADGFSYDLTGNNCVLRWAHVPATYSGPVDVVVHFHGYKGHNAMRIAAKAAASGCDLGSPGVARPTLGVVPQGHAFASTQKGVDGFDFPAISSKAELDVFVDEALAAFNTATGAHASRGRLILTGHSGGGAALSTLMRSIGAQAGGLGVEYFDGTYGGQATLTARNSWVETSIQRDAQALAGLSGDARRNYMATQGGHLRICFIDGTGTASVARAADAFMRERLAALVFDAALRDFLRNYYRAQKVTDPRRVYHGVVPQTYGGRLLADPGNDLSPEAQDLPAPTAARTQSFSDVVDDDETQLAAQWATEAQDLTVPVLVTRERAADAPTGAAFIASLGERKGVERENRIFEQLRAGNMPPSLFTFHTVRTNGNDRAGARHDFEFYVTPDVLSIGSESDAVRIPMDPVTAQRAADLFDCLLPTARMVEQIYQAAPTKLAFIYGGYARTARAHLQDASSSYLDHSRKIDAQLRRPPTILTAGHKKELVISTGSDRPRSNKETGETHPAPMLAFYGAYTAQGAPIQAPTGGDGRPMRGYPAFAHEPSFVDYSHGVRLVWPTMKVDGTERRVADVLRDRNLAPLIAAEGPIDDPRYTLDRAGRTLAARSQALGYDDPLALDVGTPGLREALGYGTTWDERIRTTVEG